MDPVEAKRRVVVDVDDRASLLLDASRELHEHPELAFEEHRAHDVLTGILERQGLAVERHACGIDTAFVARAGTTGPTVAVVCEYDALPGLGHACGHNIIAAAGLGAGLAAATLADEVGGRVVVLGTPAEEGGGGKLPMIDAGALGGVDAAMMIHPADRDLRWMSTLAIDQVRAVYAGRSTHAAAAPEQGRNALDAAVLGYVNVAALRQHIGDRERVHGVVVDGGERPNVVPARAVDVELSWLGPRYAEVDDNEALLEAFAANAAMLGRSLAVPEPGAEVIASTDMGNVSQVVPSIHPMLAVAPEGVGIHTPGFARHAGSAEGDRAVLDGAKAMAMTVVDLWLRPEVMRAVTSSFGGRRPA
jgi:metal-dependent amidase/aminoacylase/carboxypeptidase family protein